jgi:uncharacterized membrane protein (TIGR02234 family)
VTRGLRAAVLGCLLSGAVILLAGGRGWARVSYPGKARVVSGHALAGTLVPWGLVALAGVVAIAATRRWGRVPVGVALAASGAAVVTLTVRVLADLDVRAYRATRTGGAQVLTAYPVHPTVWPYLVVAAGVVLAACGVLVAVRGPRWAALGSRYDVPADRPRSDADLWAAQDRGEDPTEP